MLFLTQRAKKIKLLALDVDGVLTNNQLYIQNHSSDLRAFYIPDGLGLKLLQKTGVTVAIITAKQSDNITARMQSLGIQHIYQNQEKKILALETIRQTLNLQYDNIAYAGDDWLDIPILKKVGLGIAVANAQPLVSEYAHMQTLKKGGEGAVREICEFIMQAQNTLENIKKELIDSLSF